jgi:hypothetical protein
MLGVVLNRSFWEKLLPQWKTGSQTGDWRFAGWQEERQNRQSVQKLLIVISSLVLLSLRVKLVAGGCEDSSSAEPGKEVHEPTVVIYPPQHL